MRVVHVHRMRGIGGSERHVLELLPALASLGLDPHFLGLDDPAWDPAAFYAELDSAGVPYERLRAPSDVDPRLAFSLRRALRRVGPDIVHTHLVHADVYGALVHSGRLVSTKHNDDRFRTGPFRFVERALARRAERVIAITKALANFTAERVGVPLEKIEVIPYGLDEPPRPWGENPPSGVPDDARVVLVVSRLVEQKAVDRAVRALPAVRAEHPETVLVVLGEGPERPRLEALARDLDIADAVHLLGRVPDVAAWLRRAHVFVHPARWEGFGLALLEAMLAALPIVATPVSSIPELVGETGLLVEEDGLAAAVNGLLDDPAEARRLGEAALSRARSEFSVERMARATAAVYASSER